VAVGEKRGRYAIWSSKKSPIWGIEKKKKSVMMKVLSRTTRTKEVE